MERVYSKNRMKIRLTNERWNHIIKGHPELIGCHFNVLMAIESPEIILLGKSKEYIAIKNIKKKRHIVVIYKELKDDGFIITAFITNRINKLKNRRIVWGTFK